MPEASKLHPIGLPTPSRAPLYRVGITGLCLLAQLMGFVHLALVRHATCLEHDALVHAEGETGTDPGIRATAAATAAATPASSAPTAEGVVPSASHSDDHCLAAGCRRRELAAVSSGVVLAPAAPADPALLHHRRRALRPAPVALLRLAPKSSPPLAAAA